MNCNVTSVGFFFCPLSKIIIHYTLLNFPHFLLDQLTEELFISNGTILQTRQFYYVCIFHATTSGRSFATFSFLFFRQSSQDFFFWSGLTEASQQQLAQHDQSVSSPLLSCCGVGIEKKSYTFFYKSTIVSTLITLY